MAALSGTGTAQLDRMDNIQVLQWDMYGPGTTVAFRSRRDDRRFGLQVKRGDELLVSDVAEDGPALLRKSSELRRHLERLGFAPIPADDRSSHLSGGVCWGPASPLHSSLLDALRNEAA